MSIKDIFKKRKEIDDVIPQPTSYEDNSLQDTSSDSVISSVQFQNSIEPSDTVLEPVVPEVVDEIVTEPNIDINNVSDFMGVDNVNSQVELVNQPSVWNDSFVENNTQTVSTVQQSSITVEQKNIPQEVAQAPTSNIQPEKPVFDTAPTMEHPSEPMIMQPEEKEKPKQEVSNMPSVADILGMADQNYNQNN